jgi:hypothetical protein
MKDKAGIVGAICGVVALVFAVGAYVEASSVKQAAVRRAAACQLQLHEREQRLLAWLKPRMEGVLAQFDVEPYPESPETLELALEPLFRVVGSALPSSASDAVPQGPP